MAPRGQFASGVDRAYWISWFNLPAQLSDDKRAAFVEWVRDAYVPKVLRRDRVLWGALYASLPRGDYTPLGGPGGRIAHKKNPRGVPAGDRYILMFGAPDVYALVNPTSDAFHAKLGLKDRGMLALRRDERHNFMLEEGRIEGPDMARHKPHLAPAPAIQLGSFNAGDWRNEEEQATWYARWRLPSLTQVKGCVRVRKLVSVAGWAKHACFYEFASLEAREKNFVYYEKPNKKMVKWSTDVVRDTVHAPGSANIANRLFYCLKSYT
jgi:hypothetical protein